MLGDLHQRTLTGISQPVVSQRIKNVRNSRVLIVSQGVSSSRPLFFKQQSRTLYPLLFLTLHVVVAYIVTKKTNREP